MYDLADVMMGTLCVCLVAFLVLALIFGVVYATGIPTRKVCETYMRLHAGELEFDYAYWTGCLVKTLNGKWVSANEYMQYYGELHTLQLGEVGE